MDTCALTSGFTHETQPSWHLQDDDAENVTRSSHYRPEEKLPKS